MAHKQTIILEYLADYFKCHSGMVIFQRRDVIVTNCELCLCIDLVAIENKTYNSQLDCKLNCHIIEIESTQSIELSLKSPLNNAFQ